jgi:DNA-directed RNA polymerase subunit N (RpoN/RPB10)
MIIPVKCFTCGNVIADKYNFYLKEVRKIKLDEGNTDRISYLTNDNIKKTPEAIVLDNLNIDKYCCRRHFMTHVDIQ